MKEIQAIYFSRRLGFVDVLLQLNGRDIPLSNNVTYHGVTFIRRVAWRHHIERTVAKALSTSVRTYTQFRSGRLSTNIKLRLYRAVIKSGMTYACPTWEYGADANHLNLQRLQNRVSTLFETLIGAHQSANCIWLSKFLTCITT
jgi:hypothetical protein